ncbi:type II toxin-antitoxin system PemK/MazF family toxin [Catellatospora sp. NPDC049609]|uniref:type II toxin-antitoxin system PemK/MazF family toxin n=1 Tax=Catellatospora sp. NPDC049609 TaxID=3155505 RepID=UPI00342D6BBC
MWLLLTTLAVLAALAAAWWLLRARGTRPTAGGPAGKRPPARPGPRAPKATKAPKSGPQPGEIWWADVPYEDGTGSKVRPCVVLRFRRGAYEVLKITSQDQRHRHDHIEIPTTAWDADADHNSFLDLSDPITISTPAFANRAGTLDTVVWSKVRSLHQV